MQTVIVICFSSCQCKAYYYLARSNEIAQTLQYDLNRIANWLADNKLVLNQSKTKWLLFRTRQKLEQSLITKVELHGKNIDRVSSFCLSLIHI